MVGNFFLEYFMCLWDKLLCKIDKHTPHLLVTPEYNFCDRHQKFLSSHLVAASRAYPCACAPRAK